MAQTREDRLGCSSITFRRLPLPEALARIRAAGLRTVDIACIPGFCDHFDALGSSAQERKVLADHLQRLELRCATLNVVPGHLNADRRSFVYDYMAAAIGLAAELGCYAITFPSGRKAVDTQWQKDAELTAGLIRRLADRAQGAGVTLTLECPHVGTLAEVVPQAAQYFAVLHDDRVLATFDSSHAQRGNPRPVTQSVVEVGAPIGHVHLRDCVGENNHLTPGRGDIDFPGLLRKLDDLKYAGDLILELEGEGETTEQTEAELRFARDYLLSLSP